jgi:hypothetical protein
MVPILRPNAQLRAVGCADADYDLRHIFLASLLNWTSAACSDVSVYREIAGGVKLA